MKCNLVLRNILFCSKLSTLSPGNETVVKIAKNKNYVSFNISIFPQNTKSYYEIFGCKNWWNKKDGYRQQNVHWRCGDVVLSYHLLWLNDFAVWKFQFAFNTYVLNLLVFNVRQSYCARYWYKLDVCPSVSHTLVSCRNGSTYRQTVFTAWSSLPWF